MHQLKLDERKETRREKTHLKTCASLSFLWMIGVVGGIVIVIVFAFVVSYAFMWFSLFNSRAKKNDFFYRFDYWIRFWFSLRFVYDWFVLNFWHCFRFRGRQNIVEVVVVVVVVVVVIEEKTFRIYSSQNWAIVGRVWKVDANFKSDYYTLFEHGLWHNLCLYNLCTCCSRWHYNAHRLWIC